MSSLDKALNRFTQSSWDISFLRWGMVVIFFFFGYTKWFAYEAEGLFPLLARSPVLGWMLDAFGKQGASYALGVAEWGIGALIVLGAWFARVGIIGALGSVVTFATTLTLIASTPGAWKAEAGGFPAMGGATSFLIKDLILLGASIVLLKVALKQTHKIA